ncbi:MAG: hypothetical protein GX922_05290 [Firmicutes bacterium]|nr:hypothetical protein [Bacillota bacterium]
MANNNVVAELTELYKKKVQRVIRYQEFARNYGGSYKIKEIIAQLVAEEREHLKTLCSVIIKLLNGEENAQLPASTNPASSATTPAELALLQQTITENTDTTAPDIDAGTKTKKPLVWTFGRSQH